MMVMPDVEYLTVAEAADLLRTSERTVARLLKEGKLPGVFLGTREGWRVRRADVETWTTNQPLYSRLPPSEEEAKPPAKRRAKNPKQPKLIQE